MKPETTTMPKPLAGMYAALMTGMNDAGEFDADRQSSLNEYVLRQGLTGLYVGGSSGESGLLEIDALAQQQVIVRRDAEGSGATLIAHVGAPSLEGSLLLARQAERLGYHGLSALPPHSYPFSDGEILAYYQSLASATDLPLIVYEVPIRTGRPLPLDLLLSILDLPGVAGIKFTSTDLYKLALLRRARPERVYFFGFDEIFLSGAVLGADGGIGTTYNLLGRLYMALQAAVAGGNLSLAKQLQDVSVEFVEELLQIGVLPGMKAAFTALGVDCGPTRAPLAPRLPDYKERMAELVKRPSIAAWIG